MQLTTAGARPKDTVHSMKVQQTGMASPSQGHNSGNVTSDPRENGKNRLPECDEDSSHNDYILNCIHKRRPCTLNDVARPVFVNNYYTGESLIPVTSKKFIRLDECDISRENSVRNSQPPVANHEFVEHLRDSLTMQQQQLMAGRNVGSVPTENLQE